MTLASAAVLLFFVIDPFGNVPVFLSALRSVPLARVRRVIVRELLIALAIMILFLFAGGFLLKMLRVSGAALTAGGGFVLLLIALRMIFPPHDEREAPPEEPFVVPLAVPYTAGPSVLATELLFMTREPDRWPVWLGALVLAWLGSAFVLYFSMNVKRLLGDRGLTAMERLMGMLLVTVAVEMLMQGIAEYLRRPAG